MLDSSEDTAQTDGEGTDGSDKPPHGNLPFSTSGTSSTHSQSTIMPTKSDTPTLTNAMAHSVKSYPLPPPDTLIAGDKQPGNTRGSLQKLAEVPSSNGSTSSSENIHTKPSSSTTSQQSSTPSSPTIASPTESDYGTSAPPSRGPSRPPSQPASRAPSMSAGVSGGKILGLTSRKEPTPARPKPPSSVHSDKGDGGSHKFNLKDLLANTPKLSRKSSQRSTSSRKSDSDAGEVNGGKARSTAGDSAASLSQKYGVCQKVAIGKGATSVVRLAHKWDRSEEKLYAVKVS